MYAYTYVRTQLDFARDEKKARAEGRPNWEEYERFGKRDDTSTRT